MPAPLILIHGAWQTPTSWNRFKARYEARGQTLLAPPWPLLDMSPERLRRTPSAGLDQLGLIEIVERYRVLAQSLDTPPILMGQGLGGLIVQRLLDQGVGSSGVAIAPTQPLGRSLLYCPPHTAGSLLGAWRGWRRPLALSFKAFSRDFAQTLSPAQRSRAYAELITPAPGRAVFEALLGLGGRVNYANALRPPLLLIAAEQDRISPAAAVRRNARSQQRAASRTDLQLFAHRSHWLCNEPGWEEVADFALDWALANARPAPE